MFGKKEHVEFQHISFLNQRLVDCFFLDISIGVLSMQNELALFGDVFKKRRSELNLSLKEIENATSIRINYLEAIEEGQYQKLISPIYAQGFIKKYATFLELDIDHLIKEYPYVTKLLNERLGDKQEFAFGIGTVEVRNTPAAEVKWLPNLMWVGFSVIILIGAWFLAKFLGVL